MTAPVTALARPRSALAWLALAAGCWRCCPVPAWWRRRRVRGHRAGLARPAPDGTGDLVLVVVAAVLALPDGPVVLIDAADAMTRLTALILTVMLLSSVLGRFPDLGRISGSLFGGLWPLLQPFPGHGLLSVPLNFGSVGWWCPGGRPHPRAGDSAVTRNAARATLRGFGARRSARRCRFRWW